MPEEVVCWRYLSIRLPLVVLLVGILLLLGVGLVRAEVHRLEIKKEIKPGAEETFSTKDQQKALSRAVLREAERILAGSLPEAKKDVIREFLLQKVQDFVLSYSEKRYLEGEDTAVIDLEVRVNTQAVKEFLKKWGTYYTAKREWPYRLELHGELDNEAELRLADLESVSGLRREREVRFPVFRIRPPRNEEGRWEGTLWQDDEETVYSGESMKDLWLRTWSEYFAQREVRLKVERVMRLAASGWSTSTGIRHFDTTLKGWSTRLDRAVLGSVGFEPGGISGVWTVYTLTPEDLRSRLQSYMPSRGLDFRLESVHASRSRTD
ncbi:MAG: hypothetical protein K9K39_02690 [Desulfohalobiaceae bacterium]|nr:hypothetical protein [Desulfohalobiaceae bacterium]